MTNFSIASGNYALGSSRFSQLAKFDESQARAFLKQEAQRKAQHYNRVFMNSGKFDAKESLILQRQAIAIESTRHEIEIAPLPFRQMATVLNDGTGLESIGYHEDEKFGEFGFSPANGQEIPVSEVLSEEILIPVAHAKGMIRYTIRDMEKAARAGRPLSSLQMMALRENAEVFANRIFHYGDNDRNLPGFIRGLKPFNESNFVGGGITTKIATDPLGVVDDILGMLRAIQTRTSDRHYANIIASSPAIIGLLNTTPMSVDNILTVGEFIRRNAPGDQELMFVSSSLLANVQSTALGLDNITNGRDVLVAYSNSPRVLSMNIPRELELQPMQQYNDEFRQFGLMDIAGVKHYKRGVSQWTDETN